MKLRYHLLILAVLAALLPFHSELSSCRLTYMLGHAGILHFALNAVSYLFLWRIASPSRLLLAWCCAVACSFIPSQLPVIGWSLIIFFIAGTTLSRLTRDILLRTLAIMLVSFFIPGIAALHHAAMMFLGFVCHKLEVIWYKTL